MYYRCFLYADRLPVLGEEMMSASLATAALAAARQTLQLSLSPGPSCSIL